MKTVLYLILGLIVLIMAAFYVMGRGSANGAAPGLTGGQLAALSSKPNAVSSEISTPEDRRVAPLANTSLPAIKAVIEQTGGTITSETAQYISAVYVSSIFKFVDDVEVRMDGNIVHIRSASRAGYSDRGVNRARVEAIRAALN